MPIIFAQPDPLAPQATAGASAAAQWGRDAPTILSVYEMQNRQRQAQAELFQRAVEAAQHAQLQQQSMEQQAREAQANRLQQGQEFMLGRQASPRDVYFEDQRLAQIKEQTGWHERAQQAAQQFYLDQQGSPLDVRETNEYATLRRAASRIMSDQSLTQPERDAAMLKISPRLTGFKSRVDAVQQKQQADSQKQREANLAAMQDDFAKAIVPANAAIPHNGGYLSHNPKTGETVFHEFKANLDQAKADAAAAADARAARAAALQEKLRFAEHDRKIWHDTFAAYLQAKKPDGTLYSTSEAQDEANRAEVAERMKGFRVTPGDFVYQNRPVPGFEGGDYMTVQEMFRRQYGPNAAAAWAQEHNAQGRPSFQTVEPPIMPPNQAGGMPSASPGMPATQPPVQPPGMPSALPAQRTQGLFDALRLRAMKLPESPMRTGNDRASVLAKLQRAQEILANGGDPEEFHTILRGLDRFLSEK